MKRLILPLIPAAALPLLADAALKGAALLVLAAVCALVMRRASAAARHLVWLAAVLALLLAPVLSVVLPGWRVLPEWTAVEPLVEKGGRLEKVESVAPAKPNQSGDALLPSTSASTWISPSSYPEQPVQPGSLVLPQDPGSRASAVPVSPGAGFVAAWALVCTLLLLRLTVAHGVLRRRSARCEPATGQLRETFEVACQESGVRRPVRLLLDAGRTIPVVWGVFRPRLLLPAEACTWDAGQLRSVFMHELAHLRRRDPLVQLLTQIACALHWFNPLVWVAAWRLHVERERACDDLVLASGVRPSDYASHLLDVATKLSPARWTAACGLAMARKSSLEGRLLAVLSDKLNRRGRSRTLTAAAILLSGAVAVPVAMLRAQVDRPAAAQPAAAVPQVMPKHEYAQSLFRKWQAHARTDGKIPGGLMAQLAKEMENFIQQQTASEEGAKMRELLSRVDASRDWTQADVVALLDDITAIATAPVSWADIPLDFGSERKVQLGEPLPVELTSAAWGPPAGNGLRAAWLLEPRAERYPLGMVLTARVLFHNSGEKPVAFRTETWHQGGGHTARDGKGDEITVTGTFYSGITLSALYRLEPGEYCEVRGYGIAIGAGEYAEERSTGTVGAVIEAKEGDFVTLTHTVQARGGGWTRPDDPKDPGELWKKVVAERIGREAPMPAATADRELLIRRVTRDLFGEEATGEEVAAFSSDDAPDALERLTLRLQARPPLEPWAGELPTGATRFRVTAADPEAARAPRSANEPGRYVLGDHVHLLVRQTASDEAVIAEHPRSKEQKLYSDASRTNKAVIAFLSPDPRVASPHAPYEIALPDGIGTYGIVWERGAGVLWIMEKEIVRSYDFSNPPQVQEVRYEPGSISNVPAHLHGALRRVFRGAGGHSNPGKAMYLDLDLEFGNTDYDPREPFDPDELVTLANEFKGEPKGSKDRAAIRRLSWLISRAGAEKNARFRYLLENAEMKKEESLALALAGFDYSVNGNIEGLEYIVNELAKARRGSDAQAAVPLGFIDEWDISIAAHRKHFASGTDGAGGLARRIFWAQRQSLFPEQFRRFVLEGQKGFVVQGPNAEPGQISIDTHSPGAEDRMQWGEPVNGLRGALVRPQALGKTEAGEVFDFNVVVQNVSDSGIRFDTTSPEQKSAYLKVRKDGRTLAAFHHPDVVPVDIVLAPREAAVLRLFPVRTEGPSITAEAAMTFVAELEISATEGAWSGKLVSGETSGAHSAHGLMPKHKDAQGLFKTWVTAARADGKIPGGVIGQLRESVSQFIEYNPTWETTPQLENMLPRFDAARDWDGVEAAAFLDELAAVQATPISMALDRDYELTIRDGAPLPPSLEDAPWGEAHGNGLRLAWLLEPRAAAHPLGTPLKSRILIHNAGTQPVVFRSRTWHQAAHEARDAKGGEIEVESVSWTTIGRLVPFRLAPGAFVELNAAGVGVGARNNDEDWQNTRVGSWIKAKEGDDVTVTTAPVPMSDWNEEPGPNGEPGWWLEFIKERLSRHLPFPADADGRKRLLYQIAIELFGTPLSAEENAEFVADREPGVLDSLAQRLAQRAGTTVFLGELTSAPTRFRVLAADPDAATRPRTASDPGRYTLAENAVLAVTRRPVGERIVNEASIQFFSPDPAKPAPAGPYALELPDGYGTWAVSWVRGASVLWLEAEGRVISYDYSDPAQVKETRYEGEQAAEAPVPEEVRRALNAVLGAAGGGSRR
ncbi:MAG TPA: M56 family metallopeptidase [Verrucomicrobiales bacterium]|nr:M56 family metallopeptidase [Verrucomicrobiales bacterium]